MLHVKLEQFFWAWLDSNLATGSAVVPGIHLQFWFKDAVLKL